MPLPFVQKLQHPYNEMLVAPALVDVVFDIEKITGIAFSFADAARKWSIADLVFSDGQQISGITAASTTINFRCPGAHNCTITLHYGLATDKGYKAGQHFQIFERTVLVGISLTNFAIAIVNDDPPADGKPMLYGELFALTHLGQNRGEASAVLPLTAAGRPWQLGVGQTRAQMRMNNASVVQVARDGHRLHVQRGLAVAPPELWRAPEGVYALFEQGILYLGVAAGLAQLVEDLREALANDAVRGLPPLRVPQVLAALGAIFNYAVRDRSTGLFSELSYPTNRNPVILPSRSTANWGKAAAVLADRDAVVTGQSAAQFQQTLAPRDQERDEAIMRWLYVYATEACILARRLGEAMGWPDPAEGQRPVPRFPASMFVWNLRDATQTAWFVDTPRPGDGEFVVARQYILAAQTQLGLQQSATVAELSSIVRYSGGQRRAIAPDAQARQVLGQNKRKGDLLIQEGQALLRLRSATGEIATVRQAEDVNTSAPSGHPGEGQQATGGIILAPTGQFATVSTRLVAGYSKQEDFNVADNVAPFFLSPGQIVAALDDVNDNMETQRAMGELTTLTDTTVFDTSRTISCTPLPEGGAVRNWQPAPDSSHCAIDIVIGPTDLSRVDRTQNEASPFEDLLNVLVQGQQ